MIKAAFFDIDGTLIDSSTHTIPASTCTAIKALKKRGYKTGLATGRDLVNLRSIKQLDRSLFDAFVLSNGTCVFDEAYRCIFKQTFPEEVVKEIQKFARRENITLLFETGEKNFAVNELNSYVETANEYYKEPVPPVRAWEGEGVVKMDAFQRMGFDFAELLKKVDVKIDPCPTTSYDITPAGASKLKGIHAVMEYWGFEPGEFMCFGDQENDREMVLNAEIGVAVKDEKGSEKLQEDADFTCESAGSDGIYLFLKDQGYI